MQVTFHIEYFVVSGQKIAMQKADGDIVVMQAVANGKWVLQCQVTKGDKYGYILLDEQGAPLRYEEKPHFVDFDTDASVYDCWLDKPIEQPLYTSFFQDCVLRRSRVNVDAATICKEAYAARVCLQLSAPTISKDEIVGILGSSAMLGCWQSDKALAMEECAGSIWQVTLPVEVSQSEYKFVVLDAATHALKRYENGENRRLPQLLSDVTILRDLRLRDAMTWRGAGVAIPVFSLRSKQSWGCGDFADLRLMIDWAAATGMSVVQLLPVNDTTTDGSRSDSYPYNAVSSFALHPIYLSAEDAMQSCIELVSTEKVKPLRAIRCRYARRGKSLNIKAAVDYEATIKLKFSFLRDIYALCGEEVLASDSFVEFFAESSSWLKPYMVYSALRDKFATADFSCWDCLSVYNSTEADSFVANNHCDVHFYAFMQYLLDKQLRLARDYAHQRGVALKGDIPIGVAPHSVDVWCAPELYNCKMSAGAPPDAFAEQGQNWGFPTYNWSRMAEDGYAWWRARLKKMERYFDAYRIDHILGFFRIWEVPRDAVSAVLGHFNPSLPYTSKEIGEFGFEFDGQRDVAHDLDSDDVLFLEYPYSSGRYFPRIEGFRTAKYAALTESQQSAYMRLYEDFYYNRHNDMWRDNALKRLRALMQSSSMLTCGEDLGMIPACVADVMSSERILSLEIERMPKQFGVEFGATELYPYFSVAATSTHDMSTVRGWWGEDKSLSERYWSDVLHRSGSAESVCSAATANDIIKRHMLSGSMLAILPLQDWFAIDEKLRVADPASERINIPADANHYWRYRMHLTLEELLVADSFNAAVSALVAQRRYE